MVKNKILKVVLITIIILNICIPAFSTEINLNTTNTTENTIKEWDSSDKYHEVQSIQVPEKDINLTIENMTRGCEVYLLLPVDLFEYNMEKFIENNKDNDFYVQNEKAKDVQEFLDNKDYLGYIDYFLEIGYQIDYNQMQLRHYCFSISEETTNDGIVEYDGKQYVEFKLTLNDEHQFQLIAKDYLVNYSFAGIKFKIDEYGKEQYISLSDYYYVTEGSKISYNINYDYKTTEDYKMYDTEMAIGYIIIFVIVFIVALVLVIHEIKKIKEEKKELEKALFWKHKMTKEEIKEAKQKKKEEKKEKKKNKKK